MAGIERMAEETPGSEGTQRVSQTGPTGIEGQGSAQMSGEANVQVHAVRPYFSPAYNPKREDYEVGEEGNYVVVVDPTTGKEVARIPKVAGGSPDIPDWVEGLIASRPSVFQQAIQNYETLLSINPANIIDLTRRAEFNRLLQVTEVEIREFVADADRQGILVDVRKRALELYKQVKGAKRYEKYGGRDKQQIIAQARQGYAEILWNNSPRLKQLEGHFRGITGYVWDGIIAEIDKEVNHEESPPSNAVAATELARLREQHRIDRTKEKLYITHESYYGRLWELTAENAEELIPAVLDWVRDQIAELSDSDVSTTNKQIEDIRGRGVTILETCRVRLETEEGQDISETNPYFLRAKAFVEAVADVLGNEKVIKKGGEDISAQYAERFASNYIGHHDAIYLENSKVALISHLLSHGMEGKNWHTYWMGHDFDEEKVDEGKTTDHRRKIEEEVAEYAATHEIFLGQDEFADRNPYSFEDPVEAILLGTNDQKRQEAESKGEASLERYERRVKVFENIKDRLDAKDGITGSTPEERKLAIRDKIWEQMRRKIDEGGYFAQETQEAIDQLENATDNEAYYQILWDWVKKYNNHRIKLRLPRWYPSGWDRVRIKIDRPTKVLDRALTEKEFEAMFEYIDPKGIDLTDAEVIRRKEQSINDARFGFQLAKSYQIFNLEDAILGGIRTRLVDPVTGEYIHRVARVFDIVQSRLETAITEEENELERVKTRAQREIAAANGDQEKIRKAQEDLDKKLLSAQFIATHALKKTGFVEGKLPVWSQSLMDNSTINFFANILAAYGVNVAYRMPITHNSKAELYAILERGRRALKQKYDDATQEFMMGTYPVHAQAYTPDVFGKPVTIEEKKRIVNTGGVREHLRIVDTRFETSTSGGVAVHELIASIADLGFYPPFVKLGVKDLRGLHGYIKGWDEVQSHEQYVFNTMDPVNSAREQGAAYRARRYLVGGNIGEGKSTPGFLQEPFKGAFRVADVLRNWRKLTAQPSLENLKMTDTIIFIDLMTRWRTQEGILSDQDQAELERVRQMSYFDFPHMTKQMADELYETIYGVLSNFQDYLKATNAVESIRGGRAFRTDVTNNTVKWYSFRRAMREAAIIGEQGFVVRLGYAPEVASELSIRMMEAVLHDADYLILRDYERKRLAQQGALLKAKGLTKELEDSGLEEFMREEGYEVYDGAGKKTGKEVLGEKIPLLARQKRVSEGKGKYLFYA